MTSKVESELVELVLDVHSKRKLEQAAAHAQMTMSEFVLTNALEAADQTIEGFEKIVLGADAWDAFYDTLINPPEPNELLKRAVSRYRKRMGCKPGLTGNEKYDDS